MTAKIPRRTSNIDKPTRWNSNQVAEYLGVSRVSISNWCRDKKLPHIRLGRLLRFDPEAIKEWEAAGGMNQRSTKKESNSSEKG